MTARQYANEIVERREFRRLCRSLGGRKWFIRRRLDVDTDVVTRIVQHLSNHPEDGPRWGQQLRLVKSGRSFTPADPFVREQSDSMGLLVWLQIAWLVYQLWRALFGEHPCPSNSRESTPR